MRHLVLASASPRRQELLRRLVSTFTTVVSGVEETGSDLYPDWELTPLALPAPFSVLAAADLRLWAWRKGLDAVSAVPAVQAREAIVLAADTIVISRDELLGKPVDTADALRMLTLLRGQSHYVATGFVLLFRDQAGRRTIHAEAVLSRVTMRQFSQEELKGYVATGEPNDKAGAYALQGLGGRLVASVEGCVTTVIGLPLCAVSAALIAVGMDVLPKPAGGYCEFCARRSS